MPRSDPPLGSHRRTPKSANDETTWKSNPAERKIIDQFTGAGNTTVVRKVLKVLFLSRMKLLVSVLAELCKPGISLDTLYNTARYFFAKIMYELIE